MATGKRYYWIKLKESFMTSDTIDYFMETADRAVTGLAKHTTLDLYIADLAK